MGAALVLTLLVPSASVGQERPESPSAVAPTLPAVDVSPRGAFLRALAVPGWGHVAIGSYTRGGFYFAAQAATTYTLLRTRERLSEARDRLRFRETHLRAQLAARGVTDPEAIESALSADPWLVELRSLEDSRREQQEDLVAFGIFVLFLSGADAYVSAHLSRFPAPIELEARPTVDGGIGLGVRLPLPR